VAQARGRWDDAISHYEDALEAHARVGAPVLLAHTERHLAALLRTRGADGDWERAVSLLSDAMSIYRHLGIDGLGSKTQAVLARSEDELHAETGGENGDLRPMFRRQGDVWMVGLPDDPARLRDARGLQDIARLLAAPRKALHVADLLSGSGEPVHGADRALGVSLHNPWIVNRPVLDAETRLEYEARLTELAGELVEAERAGNAIRAAMARAERDLLTAALHETDDGDPVERARRAVGTRIRISLDRIEQAQPVVGRHLRTSIRTGTFCSYEPDGLVRWDL
jgi:tetratricopeptide (TPR) repeat protein